VTPHPYTVAGRRPRKPAVPSVARGDAIREHQRLKERARREQHQAWDTVLKNKANLPPEARGNSVREHQRQKEQSRRELDDYWDQLLKTKERLPPEARGDAIREHQRLKEQSRRELDEYWDTVIKAKSNLPPEARGDPNRSTSSSVSRNRKRSKHRQQHSISSRSHYSPLGANFSSKGRRPSMPSLRSAPSLSGGGSSSPYMARHPLHKKSSLDNQSSLHCDRKGDVERNSREGPSSPFNRTSPPALTSSSILAGKHRYSDAKDGVAKRSGEEEGPPCMTCTEAFEEVARKRKQRLRELRQLLHDEEHRSHSSGSARPLSLLPAHRREHSHRPYDSSSAVSSSGEEERDEVDDDLQYLLKRHGFWGQSTQVVRP